MISVEVPGSGHARDALRRFNKRLLNPVMLRLAGRRFWYTAAIHHTGRQSGTPYVTPVVADAAEGGYLVPLPYGEHVDWLRNVLAAGQATLDVHGRTVLVVSPVVVAAEDAAPLMHPSRALWWRLYRISRFLYLRVPEQRPDPATLVAPEGAAAPMLARTAITVPSRRPDLRHGDPHVHDLVAEVDEAIDGGDEPRVEELSRRLRLLDPNVGAGADT